MIENISKEDYLSSSNKASTINVIDDRYHIKNILLGEGSSSKINVCWDSLDHQVYAVKSISKKKILEMINKAPK